LKDNELIVLNAVKHNYDLLKLASARLKDKEEIVLAVV
jgi:hypothetical protein